MSKVTCRLSAESCELLGDLVGHEPHPGLVDHPTQLRRGEPGGTPEDLLVDMGRGLQREGEGGLRDDPRPPPRHETTRTAPQSRGGGRRPRHTRSGTARTVVGATQHGRELRHTELIDVGDPSPANVFGDVKHASANSGSAMCRSAQWTARRISSTSALSAAFFSVSHRAQQLGRGVRQAGAVVDDMAPANQGPPTIRGRKQPFRPHRGHDFRTSLRSAGRRGFEARCARTSTTEGTVLDSARSPDTALAWFRGSLRSHLNPREQRSRRRSTSEAADVSRC